MIAYVTSVQVPKKCREHLNIYTCSSKLQADSSPITRTPSQQVSEIWATCRQQGTVYREAHPTKHKVRICAVLEVIQSGQVLFVRGSWRPGKFCLHGQVLQGSKSFILFH
jgi:hypothetical protein